MPIILAELVESATPDNAPGVFVPERSRAERYIALLIFVLSFLYLCLFRNYTWVDPDEGIILQGAQRILDGQVLYRDFFSFFTPGSYYFTAAVFRLFGDSLIVARTAVALIGAGYSPLTYLLARRVCSRQSSLLVTGLMSVTALPFRFLVVHNWDSTLWACLALYCAVRLLETPSYQWAFAAASFTSLTSLFEQSKGVGLLIGLGVGFVLVAFGGQQPTLFTRRQLLAVASGLTWPFLATFLYFASQHALRPMVAGWFWPLQHYSAANRVPYGYDNLSDEMRQIVFHSGPIGVRALKILAFSPPIWIPILPLFALALVIRLAVRKVRGSLLSPEWSYYALVAAAIAGLLLSIIVVRVDHEHFFYLQPIFFLILAWMMDGRNIRGPRFAQIAPVVGLCLTMSLLTMGGALLLRVHTGKTIATRRGTVTTRPEDTVIEYVQARVAPGEHILIYPYLSLYYYLTSTYSPTRYEYYQPGMHTREQLQEMLRDVSTHPVRVVLYDPSFAEHAQKSWPNTPASAFAYDPLAGYIMREYRKCTTLSSATGWKFWFMVRKEMPCPQ